jgi:hypothetical protein
MPGNWHLTQLVNNGRIEWPSGPINSLTGGFTPRWVEAWVVQGGPPTEGEVFYTGPSQCGRQSLWSGFLLPAGATPGEWIAKEPGWRQGQFPRSTVSTPQFAIGIALMATRDNTPAYEYEWWVEIVYLQ